MTTQQKYKCNRCQHVWVPDSSDVGYLCPKCHPMQTQKPTFCANCGFSEIGPIPRPCRICGRQISEPLYTLPPKRARRELWADNTGTRYWDRRWLANDPPTILGESWDASQVERMRDTYELTLHPYTESNAELAWRAGNVGRTTDVLLYGNADGSASEWPDGRGERFTKDDIARLQARDVRVFVLPEVSHS